MNRAPARFWDLPSAAILFLLLLTASQRLNATHWAAGLEAAVTLIPISVILGMAIGFSQFKRGTVFWFSFVYSVAIVILALGWVMYPEIPWGERIADLSDRLTISLALFLLKQPVQDTILFVVFMTLVFWVTGLMAGYALTRFGDYIGAVVPAGIVLVIVQLYDSGNGGNEISLAVYVFLCLLMLGRLTYVQRRLFWQEHRVSLLTEERWDLHISLFAVALILVTLVWLAPTSAKSFSKIKTTWEKLTRPVRDVQENLGHAVAGLQVDDVVPLVNYGDILPLGQQAETGKTVYFRIQIPLPSRTQRYYWHVRSYDTFMNGQWYNENGTNRSLLPGQFPIELTDTGLLTSEFTFSVVSSELIDLVTPARPVWVSVPAILFYTQDAERKIDPIQFRSKTPVLSGEQYLVQTSINTPTVIQLRNAGEDYPAWVSRDYLQLPDSLSPEISALAQRITAGAGTPYDKAVAVTNYLRNNITYATTVEAPPRGRDPVAWFLFDSRKGFCNYYATAEVILLRSVGIPARMAAGFAQGDFEAPNTYIVSQGNSHAWPEVYFPGVGWVEFEPTTSQAQLTRPSGESSASTAPAGTETPSGIEAQRNIRHSNLPEDVQIVAISRSGAFADWLYRLIFVYIISVTIIRLIQSGMFGDIFAYRKYMQTPLPVLVKHYFEERARTPPGWLTHWITLAEMDPIERSFATIYRSLHWLGEKTSAARTPAEAAALLAGRLPEVSDEIRELLSLYQQHFYGQKYGHLHPARRAVKVIQKQTIRAAIRQRWRRFRGIFKPNAA